MRRLQLTSTAIVLVALAMSTPVQALDDTKASTTVLAVKPKLPEPNAVDDRKNLPQGHEGRRPEGHEGQEGRRPEGREGHEGRRPEGREGQEGRRPEGHEGRRPEGQEGRRHHGPHHGSHKLLFGGACAAVGALLGSVATYLVMKRRAQKKPVYVAIAPKEVVEVTDV